VAAVSAKLLRYAEYIIHRYDRSGDGQLDAEEMSAMHGDPKSADTNRDGILSLDEFARHVARFSAGRRLRLTTPRGTDEAQPDGNLAQTATPGQADATATDPNAMAPRRDLKYFKPLATGTPPWFVERDTDGDAQLTLAEFSPRLLPTEVAQFNKFDLNADGLVTPAELAKAATATSTAP